MLASGAGLIGVVVWNLAGTVRDADARAVLDARRDADATAAGLIALRQAGAAGGKE